MGHPLSGERLLELFRQMLLIRRFEEQAGLAYQMKKFGGFCHLYIGQEAVGVGAIAAAQPADYVLGTYRDHGQALARGVSPKAVMAELFGRSTGSSAGLGGSMHIFDAERRFMGGWGIVGAHLPIAAGLAFAARYRGEDAVTLCFFGEGSIHQGGFHEAMNMAAMWKLPLIAICENNHYAMGTPLARQTSVMDVHLKACGYEIPHAKVDGQNLRAVYDETSLAIARARDGDGPTLLEMKTYRFRGHSMSDPATYRTREEVEGEKQRDPLSQVRGWLIEEGSATDDGLADLDKAVVAEVKDALQFAEESPSPELATAWDHVLAP